MSKNQRDKLNEFLKEYRALCVKHGWYITVYQDEVIVYPLPEGEMALIHYPSGHDRVSFLTLKELLGTGTDVNIFPPSPDEMEQALQKKEQAFREQLKTHLHDADVNRRLGRTTGTRAKERSSQ